MDIYLRFSVSFAFFTFLTYWFIRRSGTTLTFFQTILAYSAKVLMGCAYGYIFFRNWGGDDTWMINNDSMAELEKLLNRPGQFFEDVDLFRLVQENGWKGGLHLFMDKLEHALLIKPLALFNLFSGGNYYINVTAFAALTIWSQIWLYHLLSLKWADTNKWLYVLIFFYPPALFWLSGIRGDGLLFLFFGLLLLQYDRWLSSKRPLNLIYVMVACLGIVILRAPMLAILFPALVAWWLCARGKWPVVKSFVTCHIAAVILFFATGLLNRPLNMPGIMADRQAAFFLLDGKTRVHLDTLDTNPLTFIRMLPQALDNSFLRPYPWNASGIMQVMTVTQNIFVICLLGVAALALIARKCSPGEQAPIGTGIKDPLQATAVFFGLFAYLSIGYTIPFPGALVRYRVIPELLLVIVLVRGILPVLRSNYIFFNVYKKRGNWHKSLKELDN
ncbi:hypothetical protein [Flavihumibacter solisilvae]|uniref:Glycosyltransferase RgtA/B/C/D-like domain-containing protein n=1 Tax=Flavihumibacter solisilvae TaxID=1349421 RepID=A0A0C1IFV0_9BACT|nr:hypothetical protein [Flavihumibacter solisilvae]KIC93000.1 hypothetical protein OI18_19815 [Flavihumibacter solisilvae]